MFMDMLLPLILCRVCLECHEKVHKNVKLNEVILYYANDVSVSDESYKQHTGTLVKGLVSKYRGKSWRMWLQLSEKIFSYV
jgi:hypothetical protein